MPALPQRTLKTVPAPLIESIPTAPPVLEMPNPTVEYKCGNCSAVLMHVDESKTYPLIVHCVSCGSYNSTEA
jgi:DNA-directed RNA polymerase subunit RPC12/RpoP